MPLDLKRYEGASGVNLVAPSFVGRFSEQWFDPDYWGSAAKPVAEGGRGSAWFVKADGDDLVLRHYCRGGLPGRFIRREYIYAGESAVRSFSELRLLHKLYLMGLPVPEPIAAGYVRHALVSYRAALIVRRIPEAKPLSSFKSVEGTAVWHSAGECVRRFHDAGVYHADLNCMNILAADKIYLIDFDRGRMLPDSAAGNRWKAGNVNRLERSVRKCLGEVDAATRHVLWQAFLSGYGDQ